ncbi:DUF1778 domain-containing protein [Fimbriiglobus ruber]|uniref:type II toxin-antitoxin system TacA family antitoxin n=1 Tax=Fimbriiglobus ruber TaxID=1908690 RepID=UPI000B4B5F9D|nr:DUF1778 domain-containing protein [Fimbriiglobus ruber]
MAEGRQPPPIVIHIRAEEQQRDLIDQAADHLGRSREGFVLDAACRQAEDVLLDQVFFLLDDCAFAEFRGLVDHPPAPTEQLDRLLQTKAPWE